MFATNAAMMMAVLGGSSWMSLTALAQAESSTEAEDEAHWGLQPPDGPDSENNMEWADYMWTAFYYQDLTVDDALMRYLSSRPALRARNKRDFEWERKELVELVERAKPAIERADTDTDRLHRMQWAVERYERY